MVCLTSPLALGWPAPVERPWLPHTIDASSRGADGVRMADVNGDHLLDVVTGWEEGREVRLCLHPGKARVRKPWPSVRVGSAPDVEDAFFVDLDGDGVLDVVSACEGQERNLRVHWAPREPSRILEASAWRTEIVPGTQGRTQWMWGVPIQSAWRGATRLVAGGKGAGAELGWFELPDQPRQLGQWRWHPLRPVGWIMSILPSDMDGDGDVDLIFSDRKGKRSGCFWLENPGPGPESESPWEEHLIGAAGQQVMFLALTDLDQDGKEDVLAAVQPKEILFFRRLQVTGREWAARSIALPEQAGLAKAVCAGDLDLDGRLDIVFTCEGAHPPRSGVMWLGRPASGEDSAWIGHDISGPEGVKYDLAQLIDLDGDGDLDVLTCEEAANLGVIWYENPARD